MSRQRSLYAGLLAFGVVAVLAACGAAPTKVRREDFQSTDTFSRDYSTTPGQTCEAGKRALMSQGYLIDKADSGAVTGHKNFEQAEDNSHTQIQFQVVCSPSDGPTPGSTAFVNAVQDRYTIKRSSNAASVGVTILGSVSMPFGSSPDSLVKVASETISRPEFYDGFFTLLKRNLPRVSEDEAKSGHAAASKKTKEEKAPLPPVVAPKPASEPALTPAATGLSAGPAKPAAEGGSTTPAASAPAEANSPSHSAPAKPPAPSSSMGTPGSNTSASPASSSNGSTAKTPSPSSTAAPANGAGAKPAASTPPAAGTSGSTGSSSTGSSSTGSNGTGSNGTGSNGTGSNGTGSSSTGSSSTGSSSTGSAGASSNTSSDGAADTGAAATAPASSTSAPAPSTSTP